MAKLLPNLIAIYFVCLVKATDSSRNHAGLQNDLEVVLLYLF